MYFSLNFFIVSVVQWASAGSAGTKWPNRRDGADAEENEILPDPEKEQHAPL